MQLSEIHIYPIKSLGGISLTQARLTDRGLEHDRRWMLVDAQGRFLSQRNHPLMARLQVVLGENGLLVHDRSGVLYPLPIPFQAQTAAAARIPVVIWDDTCEGQLVSAEADAWFSKALGQDCRLIYMPDKSRRAVDPRRAQNGEIVSFADGYPCLIIGQASLDLLNEKLAQPLPMNRFRPNFVFTGGAPHAEDHWTRFCIGEVLFHGVKPCVRCEITTIDQETTLRGKEPLRTLATYRRAEKGVIFGQNLLHEGAGVVKVGDQIKVLAQHNSIL